MATKIKMDHMKSNVDLHVDRPAKSAANLIEWNVDMNVTVSNVKKSKILQRSRNIFFFLVAICFAILLSHLRKEVRALQIQVQSVNVNLLLLMSKYDKLNRNLNRGSIQTSEKLVEYKNLYNIKRVLEKVSTAAKITEIFDELRNVNNSSPHTHNSIISYLKPNRNVENKYSLHDDAYNKGDKYVATFRKRLMDLEDNKDIRNNTNLRAQRALLSFEKLNSTARHVGLNVERNEYHNDYYYNNKGLQMWKEERAKRSRRDEGRGKRQGKNKRRPKRSHRRLGPMVATFVGAIPEQHVTDAVYIGPWVKSTKNNTQYSFNKFHLVEDKKSIEVTATGLYMISAQIFYFGEPTNYSYWILLRSEGKSTTQKLVKCSTASSTSAAEVSCYTSVITPLQRGDRVHIQQQERDRLINMREGHSYIQLVLLSNPICKRRSR